MTLGIVAIAWMYVVLMMALAEALSPQGTVLGAIVTLLLYGVAPLALVLYLMGTPMRRQRQRERERESTQETAAAGAAAPGDVAASAAAAAPSAQAHSPEGRTQAQDASQTAAAIRPVTPSRRNE